jgi:hypothetical protein
MPDLGGRDLSQAVCALATVISCGAPWVVCFPGFVSQRLTRRRRVNWALYYSPRNLSSVGAAFSLCEFIVVAFRKTHYQVYFVSRTVDAQVRMIHDDVVRQCQFILSYDRVLLALNHLIRQMHSPYITKTANRNLSRSPINNLLKAHRRLFIGIKTCSDCIICRTAGASIAGARAP